MSKVFKSSWVQSLVMAGKVSPELGARIISFRPTALQRLKIWWRLRKIPVQDRDIVRRIEYLYLIGNAMRAEDEL